MDIKKAGKKSEDPFVVNELKFEKIEIKGNKAIFDYYYDNLKHTKTLVFPIKLPKDDEIVNFILCNIGMCCLIQLTFFALPKKISIETFSIDKQGQKFWKSYLINMLGQKYFLDKILFKYKPKIIFSGKYYNIFKKWKNTDKILSSFGGGKDSLLQREIFIRTGLDFDLFHMLFQGGHFGEHRNVLFFPLLNKVRKGRKVFIVKFKDSNNPKKIFNYNNEFTDTTIGKSSFTMLLLARLLGYRYIAVANEKSANYGNTIWDGHPVNHQYDKSSHFLGYLNNYIHSYITPSVSCFSTLEQWYEFKVIKLFSKLKELFKISISCNIILPKCEEKIKWCCNCPKCAFTYTLTRAFMGPKIPNKVIGEDLFQRLDLIKPLCDPRSIKPFDCVGEKEETWLALNICYERGEKAPAIDYYEKDVLPKIKNRLPYLKRKYNKTYNNHIPTNIWKKLLKGIKSIENS